MLLSLLIGGALLVATVAIHYEVLRYTAKHLPRVRRLRIRMIGAVLGCFVAHFLEAWLYALAYYGLGEIGFGELRGHVDSSLTQYLYFSTTAYTTLGFGDIYPVGPMRLIAAVESLNGLLLLAWSASFTYLIMEKLWPLHDRHGLGSGGRYKRGTGNHS